ncbi:Protein O-mannosyltransferase 2 [Dinochytrium kinnereticum]|nr:Protein O-mannosyltransferase 2 [Dinochytrium kinnereticum]
MEGEGLRQRPGKGDQKDVSTAPIVEKEKDEAPAKVAAKAVAGSRSTIVYSSVILVALTAISLWTRLYRIGLSDFVVWDEAHFGQVFNLFASYYIKREFYFDVHPPLGKMLLGLSGLFVGYNGTFEFESGAKYPAELNYTGMRVFSALFGALMVPVAYVTGLELRFSSSATIFFSAMHTIEDLWDLLGNVKMPIKDYAKHWIARIIFLIILPVAIYVFSFYLHFLILNHSGSGDAQMSSIFQAGLEGNTFHENPIDVAFGSRVSLKNNGYGGGLLHSHIQTYPAGSEQQQITCYHHKDSNNEWIMARPWGVKDEEGSINFIKDGDVVRLIHDQTKKNLHSHSNFKAPISLFDYEVSCYGNETLGDANDHWSVEIVDDLYAKVPTHVKALTTRMRFRHVITGCLLRSGGATLPQWGFKQSEVSCSPDGKNDSANNIWNVEQHWNNLLPPGGVNAFRSTFLKDFVDLNVAMWTSNNALTPDPDKEPDQLVSQPYHWPFLLRGLRMCGWGDNEIKYYLLGHPVIWWASAGSFILFGFFIIYYGIRYQRKIREWTPEGWDDFYFAAKVGGLGCLHHYFPALYFAMIMLTLVVDHLTKRFPAILQKIVFGLLTAGLVAVFLYFSDFAFGFTGPASAYSGRRWLQSWNIHD